MFMLLYLGFFVIFLMRIVRKKDDQGKFDKSLMIVKKLKINFQPVDSPSHSHKTNLLPYANKKSHLFFKDDHEHDVDFSDDDLEVGQEEYLCH